MAYNVLASAQSIKNCYDCRYDSLYTHKYEFNENGNINGWDLTSNICLYGSWSSFLFGHSLDRECYISRTENFISVAAESKFMIKIVMKVVNKNTDIFKGDYGLTTGRIQWVSLEEDLWDSIKQYDFPIIADEKWHTYELNMGSHAAWVGSINNLRIYPFIDGWKKDCFAISFIGLGSTETYTCSNTNCQYYQSYSHPCKGAGSFGSITSQTNNDDVYTTISGLNDSFSININGYGYENLNLGSNIKLSGHEMAAVLTKKITDVGIGAYSYAIVEYLSGKTFKITSGALGIDSNVKIKYNNTSVTLGFFNAGGDDVSVYKQGTACEDGFECISDTLLSTDIINRLIDGNLSTSAYTHTYTKHSVSSGRSDYYIVISETVDYKNIEEIKKIALENRLKTVIDISHPIDSNGKIHNIRIGGVIHSTDQAKAYILRPLKTGEYKLIYSFNFKVKDGPQISRDPMFYSIECNEYVQKGDVVGFYNIDIFFSAGKRENPNAMYFQFDGEPFGIFNPGKLLNYGVSGFLYHCFSNNKQSNIIFDIDFGDRINIKELNIFGSISLTDNSYNIGICEDVNFLCDLYGSVHKHKYGSNSNYVEHENIGFGLEALTDGELLAINGEVGHDYINDSNGLCTLGKHSYFYVNGDSEFSKDDPDMDLIGSQMLDRPDGTSMPTFYENDPLSLYTTWDYGFSIPIEKVVIYFKDLYNFRHIELSYYLGSHKATGNATLEKYFNRIPYYNSISLDNNSINIEQNEYIYANPTYSKPIFEYNKCINGEEVRIISQTKWFIYECSFDPIDAYGFRIYSNYHKSTRISEIEIYSSFNIKEEQEVEFGDITNVSVSKYGDLWSNIDFHDEGSTKSIGIVGDSPRYIRFEFISGQTVFQINGIEGELDKNVKIEGCLDTVFLNDSKNNIINKATKFELTNTYDIPLDLDIDINKNIITSERLLLHNIPDSYDHISNSLIGSGGKVYKHNDPHTIKTVYGNCSAGSKCYLLKNLVAGKKYYSNIDNNTWKESVIGNNGFVDHDCQKNLKKNVLKFEHTQYGKYFEIGIYSPDYFTEVPILKAYHNDALLEIKNMYIGLIDGEINRVVPLIYDNVTNNIEGNIIFKDDFNDNGISSKWDVVDYDNEHPLVELDDGLYYSICNNEFPYIQREINPMVGDFEMTIKIDQDFLPEIYRSDKHVYRNEEATFTLIVLFLDSDYNEIFRIDSIVVEENHTSDKNITYNENLYKVHTSELDMFMSNSISKGEITIRRVINVVTVTSDTGKIFGAESKIKHVKTDNIKYVKILWGSPAIYSDAVFYNNRDEYDSAIENIESMDPDILNYPIGYINCVLKSIEIKRLCTINMYRRLYIEFEHLEDVTKFELYGESFWLGISPYSQIVDALVVVGIRKSSDGIIYEQVASTKSESGNFCYLGNPTCRVINTRTESSMYASDHSIFWHKTYLTEYNSIDYPSEGSSIQIFYYYFTHYSFYSGDWLMYKFGEDNNYTFDIITMLSSTDYYPESIYIYGIDKDHYYKTPKEGDYPLSDYDLLVSIPDVCNYDGFQLNYYEDMPGLDVSYRSYITIPISTKGYCAYLIKVYREDNNNIIIYNVEFKKKLSSNLLTLTLEEYNEELVIDLEKRYILGWMRHYYRYPKIGGQNKFDRHTSPTKLINLQYDNLSFSSSNVDNPNDVVWEVDVDFTDDFSDGVYNNKWDFTWLENEMLFENDGKLSVYSYGNYIQSWYGPILTRIFDKTIAIEFIIHLMCKANSTESGRTIIDIKDLNNSTLIKLVIEIINGTVESRLYEKEDLVYTGGSEISITSLNEIKILRDIKPVKLKYMIEDTIIYEYEMSSEDMLYYVDITFDKYEIFTELSEHYMSFVSITTGSKLDSVRWVKLTLENTFENFYGTYIEYLGIYPDISKVNTTHNEINCEWEQFPYDITNVIGDAVNVAKYSDVSTNYSNLEGYEVTNIINGDNTGNSGYWEFDILPNGDSPYVDIDFGKIINLKEIRLYHGRFDNDENYKNVVDSSEETLIDNYYASQWSVENAKQDQFCTAFYDVNDTNIKPNYYDGIKLKLKILVTFSVQICDVQNLPKLTFKCYEIMSYADDDVTNILLASGNVIIDIDTLNNGQASANVLLYFKDNVLLSQSIGGACIRCENYLELDYWGFNTLKLTGYNIGEDFISDFPCFKRDSSYSIQGSTTISGENFNYICPSERQAMVNNKYGYNIVIDGNEFNKYHKYDSVPIRRLRVLFNRWDGVVQTRYNHLTNSYESFTGSYLREIEVYEYNPREKILGGTSPIGYSYGDGIPVPFISSFDYPIIAFDLGNKYDITQIKTAWPYRFLVNPEVEAFVGDMKVVRPWYIQSLDIRYSDDIYSDPSKITFSSKDNKQMMYISQDSSGVVLSYLGGGSEVITEYIFDRNIFINKGSYDVYFEAYLATSESKISILFEGNNFYECKMTTVASGIAWEDFYESVDINESGFYTIKAKQNTNLEEDWGLRSPILYLIQGDAKQWVALIHDYSFTSTVVGTLNYITMCAGNGFGPTENGDWWESIHSSLSTERMIVKESASAVRIDYPGGFKTDKISYREGDCFSQDENWSIRDKLTVWFYISDINSIDFSNSYIIYGNIERSIFDYGTTMSDDPSYYIWRLDNYNIINGWNKLKLKFDEYFEVFPKDVLDEFNLTGSISNLLQYNDKFGLSIFQLHIDGKENPCTIILDTLKYERTEFLPVKENNGVYLSGTESLIFNINNLSLKRGTVEFDVKLSSDNTGKNIFGNNNAVTLLSIITNSNEIITLFISIGKGLNICVGTIGKELYITDTYFSSEDMDNYIGINGDARIKVVWSSDGTEMDNSDTFRLYVDNEWLYSINDKWAINSNNISSIIFGGMTTFVAAVKTDGSGVFSNIKVYNYCKLDNNVISDTIGVNDFLEISKDNENFFKAGDENLPIQFKGVDSGETITAYVRSNKENNFSSITEATGNLIASWTLIV